MTATTNHEIVVRLRTDMLSIGSAFISSQHILQKMPKASTGAPPALTQIGNTAAIMISPFSLRGWLRHGVESYLQEKGVEVCHPLNKDAIKGATKKNPATGKRFADEDLEHGYHLQGECLDKDKEGCLVVQLFGHLTRPSAFMQKQVIAQPIKARWNLSEGIGGGNYRMVQISPTTRSPEGTREPFRTHEADILAFVDVPWRLKIRENISEEKVQVYLGLFSRVIEYLDAHREDFFHQLGGKRNMGCGIVRTALVNPLYREVDLRKLTKPNKPASKKEENGEERVDETELEEELDLSRPRGTGVNEGLDTQWTALCEEYHNAFERALETQRALYPLKNA